MMRRHAEASSFWFVRTGHGWQCQLRPHSRAGWLLTAAYVAAMIGASLLLVARDEPTTAMWAGWAVISLAMTGAFLLVAWRTSDKVEPRSTKSEPKTPTDQAKSLVIALLTAAAIVGAAFLGILA